MKNIWILNHYGTDMYRNQGGRHYWFAENLIKRGYSVTIFCANTYHNTSDYIKIDEGQFKHEIHNKINFVFIKTNIALGNGLNRIRNMSSFYFKLFGATKTYEELNGKPDVILASSVHPLTMLAGVQIGKRMKIPCICEVRDLWPEAIFQFSKIKEESLIGKLLIKGEKYIYEKSDALIFTKEGDIDYLIEKGWTLNQGGKINLEKVFYINNGVDIEGYESSILNNNYIDEDLNKEKFNVLYVGSIRPVNNVGKILDAAKLIPEESGIQFLIYGDGNQRNYLEKRVSTENISNVKIKGFVEKKYIPNILSKSSINLLNYSSSDYNWSRGNSSNKLFEYMASGKPIISNVKMGYSLIDRYKMGFELNNDTKEELAETIIKIKNMSESEYEKMSSNARKAAEHFDFNILTDKLIEVINSTIEGI